MDEKTDTQKLCDTVPLRSADCQRPRGDLKLVPSVKNPWPPLIPIKLVPRYLLYFEEEEEGEGGVLVELFMSRRPT